MKQVGFFLLVLSLLMENLERKFKETSFVISGFLKLGLQVEAGAPTAHYSLKNREIQTRENSESVG